MNTNVYSTSGEVVTTIELPASVFGLAWNENLMHQVVTSQMSNMRRGTAHAKDRSEVRGGGRKPWRQKGTGRARHGSIRSPIWKGGGVTHGPRMEKNYEKKINRKMARRALHTALSAKARDLHLIVVDDLRFEGEKTKIAATFFKRLAAHPEFSTLTRHNGALVALFEEKQGVIRSMRNIPFVALDDVKNLNAMKVLKYKFLMIPKEALGVFGGATEVSDRS